MTILHRLELYANKKRLYIIMQIKRIVIENFQSYFEPQTIEFSKGLNLIIGNGGKGKSKFFNAFYWALFGNIYITDFGWANTDGLPFSAKMAMKKHDYFNKRALHLASTNEIVIAKVCIELENFNTEYSIERSTVAKCLDHENWDNENSWCITDNELKITYDSNAGTVIKYKEFAKSIVDDLFPEGIRNYIWFQGESLDSLLNFRKRETLKAAVKHISYFPYYEKLSQIITCSTEKIKAIELRKSRELNRTNTNVRNLASTIETNRLRLIKEEEDLRKIENDITELKVALSEDEGKLSGLASFTGLVSEFNQCELDLSKIMNELTNQDNFQREKLPNLWILRGIEPMVKQCKEIIHKHTQEQDTTPEKKYLDNPGRAKLEEILYIDHRCYVCGSDVSKGSKAYQTILQRMKDQEDYLKEMEDYQTNLSFNKKFERFIGSITDYPDSLLVSISTIDKQYNQSENEIERLQLRKKTLLERKAKLDVRMEEIKKKYGVNPKEGAERANVISSGIRATRYNLQVRENKLKICKENIRNYKNEIKLAEKELEKFNAKSGNSIPETEWKNISVFLEDICKDVQEKARKELLIKIEDRSNQFYKQYTKHDNGFYGKIGINNDYSINIESGLSTSQIDRAKMSIINAMLSLNQDALGIYYPFISDAPTSSFDPITTRAYLLGIKDVFEQSIIMTKDVDIDNSHYKGFVDDHKVSKIYLLDSQIYCDDSKAPEQFEVSTKVIKIKG